MRTRLAVLAGAVLASAFLTTPASAADPALRFHSVQYDSPGKDDRTDASLNAEWVSLINTGPRAISLTGWSIQDAGGHAFSFGKTSIPGKGGQLWIHTGPGTDNGTHLYWNSRAYVWNNTGDTARLLTASGKLHDTCSFTGTAARTAVTC